MREIRVHSRVASGQSFFLENQTVIDISCITESMDVISERHLHACLQKNKKKSNTFF